VIVLGDEPAAAVAAKVDVGLVDDYHLVPVGLQDGGDLLHRDGPAGGGVGVGDDDGAAQVPVVRRVQAEALPEGDGQAVQAVELGVYQIEAVAEGGEGHRPLPVAKGHEAEIQDIVGAVGEKHVLRGQAEVVRQLSL